jgi:hypothetical protein
MYNKQELGELSWCSDGLDGPRSTPGKVRLDSSPQCPDRLWAHPASYPMDIGRSFLGGKAAGVSMCQLPSNSEFKNDGAIALLPNSPSWHSA